MPDPLTPTTDPTQSTQSPSYETFEAYLETVPEEIKTLYATHTSGLKSALDNERNSRKLAETSLRDLAKKAEKGSELEKTLTQQADELSKLQTQSTFYDKAHAAGVRNLKLAFMAAREMGLVSDKGDCDFAKLKTEMPELFIVNPPPGNAGNGSAQQVQRTDMNNVLRGAFGR
jgi:hypothetical protein